MTGDETHIARERWGRALRYPFINPGRDLACRIFAIDSEKVPCTINTEPVSVSISRGAGPCNWLVPERQRTPVSTFNIKCKTSIGVYEAKDRIPLLAIGSNSSDEQLYRKFHSADCSSDFLVMPGWLQNYAVVYMPLIAPYGSIPATIYPVNRSRCRVTVGFFSVEQARHIIGTETPYDVCFLNNSVHMDNDQHFADALAFVSRSGNLSLDGKNPVLIKEIPHQGEAESLTALNQLEIQNRICEVSGMYLDFKELVCSHIDDAVLRKKTNKWLQAEYAISNPEEFGANIISAIE